MVLEINKFAVGKSLYECGRDCPSPLGGHFDHHKSNWEDGGGHGMKEKRNAT